MTVRRRKTLAKGYSLAEAAFALAVAAFLGFFIYKIFLEEKKPDIKPPDTPGYLCMTTPSGFLPVKVVIANPSDAPVYNDPSASSPGPQKDLKFFDIFFLFKEKNGFYQVATNPYATQPLGWIKKTDAIKWDHREGLKFSQHNKTRRPIWANKSDIGDYPNRQYTMRTDINILYPFPILDNDGDRYRIALTWQSETWDENGAAIGWTDSLNIPQDAEIVCYITKNELQKHLEKLLATIKELQNKPYSDHPILQLLKDDLGIAFGEGLNLENSSIGYLKQVAGQAPKMPGVFKKLPQEIRGELQKIIRTFAQLKEFYTDIDNWDSGGGGWIPLDLIPGS